MLNFAQRINEVILLIKRSVFKLSNHGFLLVEHLIALSITALLVLLITQLLPLINFYQADLNQVTQQEISVLRTQLQKEAKRANHFSNTSSQFQIHLANGTVPTYYISNHRLMRRVRAEKEAKSPSITVTNLPLPFIMTNRLPSLYTPQMVINIPFTSPRLYSRYN